MDENVVSTPVILVLGKNGQVGWELNRVLQPLGKVIALDRSEADLSNPEGLRSQVKKFKPDVIVNAAAYTAVDKAEEEEGVAYSVNGASPGVLAEVCLSLGALLIHYSTDYVFDGSVDQAYIESDSPNPINIYGSSKLAGEQNIQSTGCDYLILRTSWVYASRGSNFLLTILRLASERDELNIVGDQYGAPTSARLIAETTSICIRQSIKERASGVFLSGIYHLTSSGCTTWHGFAEAAVSLSKNRLTKKIKNL